MSGRCKACDSVMDGSDFAENPFTGDLEDLCRKCRDIVNGFDDTDYDESTNKLDL